MNAGPALTAPPKAATGSSPTQSIESIITKHPFLEGMTPHQLRLLTDCAMRSHFMANEVIFREGDPANRFYLIDKGSVVLEAHAIDNSIIRIATIGAGDVLGWSWLFPPYFWHFEARAVEPTDAIFIYGTALREECESDHELGYELVKRMAEVMLERLQATRRQLLNTPRTIR
jgi:CRP/FNR family transcriptional regulator, cyclic AMP receptor protein